MIRQDVLVVKFSSDDYHRVVESENEFSFPDRYLFLTPSKVGADAVRAAGMKLAKTFEGILFAVESGVLTEVPYEIATSAEGDALYRDLRNSEADVHFTDVPLEVAILNAEQMKIAFDEDALSQRMADYFGPLFDAAIEARDKARITELFFQFPQSVSKAFILDRLRYGSNEKNNTDAFPELREPGVTLQNWHRSTEV